jgi:TPR repeat protein
MRPRSVAALVAGGAVVAAGVYLAARVERRPQRRQVPVALASRPRPGDPAARALEGIAYAFGLGGPRDRGRALEATLAADGERAADTFHWYAQTFERGADGVPANEREAFAWYVAAAERGHRQARSVVAAAYRDGRYGVTPDPGVAAYWEGRTARG